MKKLQVVLLVLAALGGVTLCSIGYEYYNGEYQANRVVIDVSYSEAYCLIENPIKIEVRNDSARELELTAVRVAVYVPGYSKNIADYGDSDFWREYRATSQKSNDQKLGRPGVFVTDKFIPPSSSAVFCFSDLKLSEPLATGIQRNSLEYMVGERYLRFSGDERGHGSLFLF